MVQDGCDGSGCGAAQGTGTAKLSTRLSARPRVGARAPRATPGWVGSRVRPCPSAACGSPGLHPACKHLCASYFWGSVWRRLREIVGVKQLLRGLEAALIKGVQKSQKSLFSSSWINWNFLAPLLRARNNAMKFRRTCQPASGQEKKKKEFQILHCSVGKEQMGKAFFAGFCLGL